jgi:hypothetical protein
MNRKPSAWHRSHSTRPARAAEQTRSLKCRRPVYSTRSVANSFQRATIVCVELHAAMLGVALPSGAAASGRPGRRGGVRGSPVPVEASAGRGSVNSRAKRARWGRVASSAWARQGKHTAVSAGASARALSPLQTGGRTTRDW